MPKKGARKKAALAKKPAVTKQPAKTIAKPKKKDKRASLFEKTPKNFGIGNDIQPRRDMTRFVRWPKYIKIQRQRRVLLKRLKVPPVISQFNATLDKSSAAALFNFLAKYSPETRKQKTKRLKEAAAVKPGEKATPSVRRKAVKCGLNHVTSLIESRKAKLVIIAHDVDPIELVLWLPTLCRKKGIPYLIVKGKSRLGAIVHKKTATALAVDNIDKKDEKDLTNFITIATDNFNSRYTDRMKTVGGGIMGYKHVCQKAKEERRRIKESKKSNK